MELAEQIMEADLVSPEFLSGAAAGAWGRVHHDQAQWPRALFWLAVPPRVRSPDRYYVLVDATGYRCAAPTGTFADPQTLEQLAPQHRPKGKEGSRFAKVFRTDWENGRAFYHPFDRVAASSHADWVQTMPNKVWTPNHTIVDWLDEFCSLFQSEDYLGVHLAAP